MSKPRHKPHTDDEIQALLGRLTPAYDIACKYDKQHLYVAKDQDPILSTALRDCLLVIEQLRDDRNTASFKLQAYREHSVQRGVTGSSCRLCFGAWAISRGEGELHETYCPNYEAPKP